MSVSRRERRKGRAKRRGRAGTSSTQGGLGAQQSAKRWAELWRGYRHWFARVEKRLKRARKHHRGRHLLPSSRTGILFALVGFLSSFTPSLMPRDWASQGLVTAIAMTLLYGVGKVAGKVAARLVVWLGLRLMAAQWVRYVAWPLSIAAIVVAVVSSLVSSYRAGLVTAELVEMPAWSVVQFLAAIAFALLLAYGGGVVLHALGAGWGKLRRLTAKRIKFPVLDSVAAVSLVLVMVLLFNGVVLRGILEAGYGFFVSADRGTDAGFSPPTSPLRSGSPQSLESWESLGRKGRVFVGMGPAAGQIAAVTGRPAVEPIRVYAAATGERGIEGAVAGVLAEMDRTGAWERGTILLLNPAGSGWVDEYAVGAVEYLTGGDVASVAIQYTVLPSFAAVLTDRQSPIVAARTLFAAVRERLDQIEPTKRPKLLLTGSSLGAYGGLGSFADMAELVGAADASVWTGVPGFTPLHQRITAERHPGSPQIVPVVDNGRHVRFMTGQTNLHADLYGRPYGDWELPRVAFLQHSSDAVVAWNPRLAVEEPQWLRERSGPDVNPQMQWHWMVTFWQVSMDMVLNGQSPAGHGHFYRHTQVRVWQEVLAPHGQEQPWGPRHSERVLRGIEDALSEDINRRAGY